MDNQLFCDKLFKMLDTRIEAFQQQKEKLDVTDEIGLKQWRELDAFELEAENIKELVEKEFKCKKEKAE